jgi:hypothetical protein
MMMAKYHRDDPDDLIRKVFALAGNVAEDLDSSGTPNMRYGYKARFRNQVLTKEQFDTMLVNFILTGSPV